MEISLRRYNFADDARGRRMKSYIYVVLLLSLVLFPLFGYTYRKGCQDGVIRYQHSKQFMLTLYRMYMFGMRDGYDACKGVKK
jgi:hypothetical protein